MFDLVCKRSRYPFNYRGCQKGSYLMRPGAKLLTDDSLQNRILKERQTPDISEWTFGFNPEKTVLRICGYINKTAPDKRLFQYRRMVNVILYSLCKQSGTRFLTLEGDHAVPEHFCRKYLKGIRAGPVFEISVFTFYNGGYLFTGFVEIFRVYLYRISSRGMSDCYFSGIHMMLFAV